MMGNRDEAGESGEVGFDVLAEIMYERERVTRAAARLEAARRRLSALEDRYRGMAPFGAAAGAGEPLLATVLDPGKRSRMRRRAPGAATMRARILEAMGARPGEVLTTASLASIVGAESRDSVRNTLLALAAKGRIEKVGLGRYRLPDAAP